MDMKFLSVWLRYVVTSSICDKRQNLLPERSPRAVNTHSSFLNAVSTCRYLIVLSSSSQNRAFSMTLKLEEDLLSELPVNRCVQESRTLSIGS